MECTAALITTVSKLLFPPTVRLPALLMPFPPIAIGPLIVPPASARFPDAVPVREPTNVVVERELLDGLNVSPAPKLTA